MPKFVNVSGQHSDDLSQGGDLERLNLDEHVLCSNGGVCGGVQAVIDRRDLTLSFLELRSRTVRSIKDFCDAGEREALRWRHEADAIRSAQQTGEKAYVS